MYTEYQSHGPEDGLTEWTMLCGPQGKLCKICSPRLNPRLQFPRFPRFPRLPQFPVASVESVSRSTSRTSRETLAKPELNIAKFPKAKRRPKGSRSLLTLSTCESEGYEGYEGCQRCEGESGPSGPSGASKLGRRARTRAAQYCHGFFNGAGKVHISHSDCKAEITARLEFKASWRLVIFHCFT